MQIDFLGEKVELSDAKLNFISIRKVLCEREKEASRKFWDIHSDFNTLEGMIEGVNSVVLSEINKAMQDVIGFLQNEGVYDFNDSLFWEKYVYPMGVTDPWEEAIDDLVDKCQRIDGQNQAAHQYREQRKQSRGRWIGGGYGVQGAIKGSMQAGVMNMGTGAAHSMINGIGNAISNGIANSEKRLIMNDFKTTCELALGLEKTMQEMVYAAGKALEDCGIPVEYPTEEDKKRAEAIIDSIRKQIVPADKRIEQIIRAWNYDPFNSTLYSTILDAGLGKMQDIAEMMDVVGVDADQLKEAILIAFTMKLKVDDLDEDQTRAAKTKLMSLCEDFGYDRNTLKNEDVRDVLKELDDRLLYYAEKPIMSYLSDVSVNSLGEEGAKKLLEKIKEDCVRSHFDFDSLEQEHKSIYEYVEAIEQHLKRIDRNCRTVDGVVLETREEAQQYKDDIEIYEKLIKYRDIVSEEGYQTLKEDIEVIQFKSEKFKELFWKELEEERKRRDFQGCLADIRHGFVKINFEDANYKRLYIRGLSDDFPQIEKNAIRRIESLYKNEEDERLCLYFDAGKKEEHTPGLLITNHYVYLYKGSNKYDEPVGGYVLRLIHALDVTIDYEGIILKLKNDEVKVNYPLMFDELTKYEKVISAVLAALKQAYYNDSSNEAFERIPKQDKTMDPAVKEKQEKDRFEKQECEKKEILGKFGNIEEVDMETVKKCRAYVYTTDIDFELKRQILQQIQRRYDSIKINEIEKMTAGYEELGEDELLRLRENLSSKYPSRLTADILGCVDQRYRQKKEERIEREIKECCSDIKGKSRQELLEINNMINEKFKGYDITLKYSQEILGEIELREKEQLQSCMVGYEIMDREQLMELVKAIALIEYLPTNKEYFEENTAKVTGLLSGMDVQYVLSQIGKPDGKMFLQMENDLMRMKEMELVDGARKEIMDLYKEPMKAALKSEIMPIIKKIRGYLTSNFIITDGVFLPGDMNFDKAHDLALGKYELGPNEDIIFMHFTATLVSETLILITNKALYFKGNDKKRVDLHDIKDFTIIKNMLSYTLMCNLKNGSSEKLAYKSSGKQHTQICNLLSFIISSILDSSFYHEGSIQPNVERKTESDDNMAYNVSDTLNNSQEKTMTLDEKLESLFTKYQNIQSFRCTPKLKTGLMIPDNEKIYLAYDNTVFSTGKNGFAISARGFYCRGMADSTVKFIPMDEIKNAGALVWEDSYLKMGDKSIMYYSLKLKDSLKKDTEELIEYLKQS